MVRCISGHGLYQSEDSGQKQINIFNKYVYKTHENNGVTKSFKRVTAIVWSKLHNKAACVIAPHHKHPKEK